MYAQYIAAQAFNSGGLGIIHSISHAVSAFYDTHHGLNNAIALPRVWAFNMPVAYKRFADIAGAMGVDTHGMTDVQAAEAALAAAIRLLRDVGIPEQFIDVTQDTLLEEPAGHRARPSSTRTPRSIKGDAADVDRITNHVLGDACTPGQRQGVHVRDGAPGGRPLHERRPRRPADLSGRTRPPAAADRGRRATAARPARTSGGAAR